MSRMYIIKTSWEHYIKDRNGPRSKHNQQKASVARVNRAGGSEHLSRGFRRWSPMRKFLGSKEHLDWLKVDLNAVEIRTVQDFKCTKN